MRTLLLLALCLLGCANRASSPGVTARQAVTGIPIIQGSLVRSIDAVEAPDGRLAVAVILEEAGGSCSLWLWHESRDGAPHEVTRIANGILRDAQVFAFRSGFKVTYADGDAVHLVTMPSLRVQGVDSVLYHAPQGADVRALGAVMPDSTSVCAAVVLGEIRDWYGLPSKVDSTGLWILRARQGGARSLEPVLLRRDLLGEQPQPHLDYRDGRIRLSAALRRRGLSLPPGYQAWTWDHPILGDLTEQSGSWHPATSDSLCVDKYGQPIAIESLVSVPATSGAMAITYGRSLQLLWTKSGRLKARELASEFGRTGLLNRGRGVDVAGRTLVWIDHSAEMEDVIGQAIDLANGGAWTTNQVHLGALAPDLPPAKAVRRDELAGAHSFNSCVRLISTTRGPVAFWAGFPMAGRNPGRSNSASQVWYVRQQ